MAGYLGTKAVLLSTTAADVIGNAEIGGDLTVGGNVDFGGGDLRFDTSANIYGKADNTGFVSLFGGGSYNSGAGVGVAGSGNASANSVIFTRGAYQESMRIDSSGKVGIGTSSPTGLLTLDGNGDAYIAITHSSAMAGGLAVQNRSSGGEGVIAYNSSPSDERWEFFVNSSEKMRIDTAGRVTMPYQPAFYATNTGGTVAYPSGATFTFNIDAVNRGGHFNGATGRFTAPVAGLYSFSFNTFTTSGPTQAVVKLNGSDWLISGSDTEVVVGMEPVDGSKTGGATVIINLSAGDYVSIGLRTGYADSIYMGHTYFCGYLIG